MQKSGPQCMEESKPQKVSIIHKIYYLNIPCMKDESHLENIRNALRSQPEVSDVELNLALQTAKITVTNPKVTADNLIVFIRENTLKKHQGVFSFEETVYPNAAMRSSPSF